MKLSNTILASTAIVLGIAACASPAADEHEELGTTSQALCPKGVDCTPKSAGTQRGGAIDTGDLVLDPGTGSSGGSSGTRWGNIHINPGDLYNDPGTGGSSGTTTDGETITCGLPPGATFECAGPAVICGGATAKLTGPCDMTIRCSAQGCDCVPGCSGGSYSFGAWSPCMWGQSYTCIGSYCRCN